MKTARELLAALQALPPEQLDLPLFTSDQDVLGGLYAEEKGECDDESGAMEHLENGTPYLCLNVHG